jgi:UDP-xylose/UDP-N-acetylglucosamine transporter B4
MVAGYMYGKKYARLQAIAVVILSIGVVLAAWSDAQEKVRVIGNSTSMVY